MSTKTVAVPAISCSHCTHTIEMELGELAGVTNVTADVDSKQVAVEWDEPADWEQIEALMIEIDFPPTG